ncbi:MAG TPA: RNA polymerase sigma factor [Candidatus Polarisedimenticolaceae bacterium]|nr:RNA polymerase sigma factor [Candidatus Polarisedimenticolaceae bacterium]
MDDRGFERAVIAHKDRVFAFATAMLKDGAEAQDVSQESLIRLWQNRNAVEEDGTRPWLMRTAHNLCIDRLRKRKVRGEIAEGDTVVASQVDHTPGPQQAAESSEIRANLQSVLGELPAVDRAVLVMREIQGLPYEEIAGVLGLPLGTLKARLHRARDRLRSRLVRAGVTP